MIGQLAVRAEIIPKFQQPVSPTQIRPTGPVAHAAPQPGGQPDGAPAAVVTRHTLRFEEQSPHARAGPVAVLISLWRGGVGGDADEIG
jgi:hypothetical protein